jgi:hypothetical protein
MIPKIDNAFLALENGVDLVEIGGTKFILEPQKAQ